MTTIRDQMTEELLARLQAELDTWTVKRQIPGGDVATSPAAPPKLLILLDEGEQVLAVDSMTVTKELSLVAFVQVRAQDAPSALGGNPERYLGESVAEVESAALTPPWLSNGESLQPSSWKPGTAENSALLRAEVRWRIRYRHNISDPSTFNPLVTS